MSRAWRAWQDGLNWRHWRHWRHWQGLHLPLAYVGFFLPTGVLLGYLPPFLRDKGLAPDEVAWIFSTVFGVKLLTGPLLAWWADASRRQSNLLWAAAWAGCAAVWLLDSSTHFGGLLVGVVVIAACRNYFQSLLEALATRLKDGDGCARYGSMRALGSASVCAGVLLFGGLWSAGPAWQQAALPMLVLVSALVLLVSLHAMQSAVQAMVQAGRSGRTGHTGHTGHMGGTGRTEKTGPTGPAGAAVLPPGAERHAAAMTRRTPPSLATGSGLLLLAGATLLIGANGVFYSSATLLLQQRGVGGPAIAALWCAAFGVEALGFAAFDRLRAHWGNARVFGVIVMLSLLRWSLLAADGALPWLLLGFVLHVASFSWMHALCALWVRDLSPSRYAITGQAVYTACGHGIGLAGAAWFASRALPTWGAGVYGLAATMTAAGALAIAARAALAERARVGAALQA
ncbi:MFS transporter [Rhizobacter sp. SG703]|uniref:MFS transporter n=1 Tax=Rhizobacter sp. SG703 TaxID=2587140 RepID=UPI0017A90960|nr:putative MFS family arabinose efflux permease [Rhizobacter sp. SG703]